MRTQKRSVSWLGLKEGSYQPLQHSALIELGPAELTDLIRWPQAEQD